MAKLLKIGVALFLLFTITTCKSDDSIKIGFAAGLTGTNSELGVNGMYGVELAVEIINSNGGIKGRKIDLIIQDDQSNPVIALEVDKKFVEVGCKAIIGHMISGVMDENIAYVNGQNIILISPTISTDLLSHKDDHFLRIIPSNITQAQLIAASLINQGVHRLAFLSTQNNASFTDIIKNEITKLIVSNDIEIVFSETYVSEGVIDYQTITQSLMDSKADGVVLLSSSFESANFAQLFALSHFQSKIFLPAWAMTNDLIQRGGTTVENLYGVNYFDFNSKQEKYVNFVSLFYNKYSFYPTFASMFSYEAMMILAEAMSYSKTLDASEIKTQLLSQSEFVGLQDSFRFNQYGDVDRKIYFYQIKNGRFIKVEGN